MSSRLLNERYQVVQVLASGGCRQTYLAQDTCRPGSPNCVVKHLSPVSNDSKSVQNLRRLFAREAQALQKLGSYDEASSGQRILPRQLAARRNLPAPGSAYCRQVPQLLDHFEENNEFYLVQKFIAGHLLSAELLPSNRWSERQVVQLLQEVLGILEFVHSQGLIHRDIKPSNLIRRKQDNRFVLIDFSSVKQTWTQVVTTQGQTSTNLALGTPATFAIGTPGYMPTEQGRGRPRPNSDIYALGMIGIQALTGLSPTQLLEDAVTGEVIWQHRAQVSADFACVLNKMVRSHFKDRYQSATEALQVLQQLAAQEHIDTAPGESSAQQVSTFQPQVSSTPLPQTAQSQTKLGNSPSLNNQVIDESFVRQCEQELADLIGPIANFLVQEALRSCYQISPTELVKTLAGEISDPQKAFEFQQRLLS